VIARHPIGLGGGGRDESRGGTADLAATGRMYSRL
jgi:hypothetical protein